MKSNSFFNEDNFQLISNFFKNYLSISKDLDIFFSISSCEHRVLLLKEIIAKNSYFYIKQNFENVFSILKETKNSITNFIKQENSTNNVENSDKNFQLTKKSI